MLKSIVLFNVFCLSLSFHLPPTNRFNLDINRSSLKQRLTKAPYHHDPSDFAYVTFSTTIGSNKQIGKFVVDTIAADLQVNLCPFSTYNPEDGECFQYTKSATFKKVSDRTAEDSIADAFEHPIKNVTFAVSTIPSKFMGNIGLGWPAASKYPGETTFPMDFLRGTNKKMFAVAISLTGCESIIEYGGAELCKENGNTSYLPNTSGAYWQFGIDGARLGTAKTIVRNHVVIDTKTEYIGMPKKFLQDITSQNNITWDGLYGAYTVECRVIETLPSLEFSVAGGTLNIHPAQYVYLAEPLPNGKCVVSFEDSKAYGFGPDWYIGLEVLTDYCVSFDYEKKRIGFSQNTLFVPGCHHG
ncbi:hypothetical protein QR680_003924 [Steinernema hermaphroditum]|uniref:Peptidase A1 domain-containing protein n=1 Tax=Steinernema hermaphroditum TaxID=289476 RepID=A0AA39HPB7_9BILA|nr:hypothetical protein QR680_003924 [Steinernema hermaphroditum]